MTIYKEYLVVCKELSEELICPAEWMICSFCAF